jgi:hypothetical protein
MIDALIAGQLYGTAAVREATEPSGWGHVEASELDSKTQITELSRPDKDRCQDLFCCVPHFSSDSSNPGDHYLSPFPVRAFFFRNGRSRRFGISRFMYLLHVMVKISRAHCGPPTSRRAPTIHGTRRRAWWAMQVGAPRRELPSQLTPKVWTDKNGEARPCLDFVAHAVLTAYHVIRKRQAVRDEAA